MACYGINFDRVRQPVHSDDENDMIKCSVLPSGVNHSGGDQNCAIMVNKSLISFLFLINNFI